MEREAFLSLFDRVTGSGDQYHACCPAHEDRDPSLAIKFLPDGRILIHCYAGCGGSEVLQAVNLTLGDLYPDGALREHYRAPWWATKQMREKRHEETILEIGKADRAKGKRLSQADLRRERLAWRRVNGK